MNQAGANLKTSAYYISQYFWLIYVVGPLLLSFLFPYKTDKKVIFTSQTPYNSSKDPIVFAHLTDIHINRLTPASVTSFQTTVSILKSYAPEFIVISGDITDNYEPPSNPRYGDEIEENWQIYKREISNISDIPIVEVAGNHDQFGVKGVLSHKNFIVDYSRSYNRNNTKSESDYDVRTITVGPSQTNIICINPFEFPTGHPPLLFFMKYSTKLLDKIIQEIEKNDKSIVMSHFPIPTQHNERSSNGQKFADIIGSNEKVLAYLTGHTHPKTMQLYHQGKGGLEIIGPSNYYASKFGVVTLDNDMIGWTEVELTNPLKGVISYPIKKSQISTHTNFKDIQNSEIRVIMFSERKDLEIDFSVIAEDEENKVIFEGRLNYCKSLNNGKQSLYTYPMNEVVKGAGSYNVTFSGDFNESIEFFVGDLYVSESESMPTLFNTRNFLFITFPVFFLLQFVITFVFPFSVSGSCFDTIEEWIETSIGDSDHWIVIYLLGFLLVRTRFQRTPVILKLFVFCSVVFGVVGPIFLFETEDLTGYITVYGYYIDNKFVSADFGMFFSYFYLLCVTFPMIIMCSSLSVVKWNKKQDGDLIVALATIIGNALVLINFAYECVGKTHVFSSIGYIGIPLVYAILFIYFFFAAKQKFRCLMKNEQANQNSLNDNYLSYQNILI